MVTGGDRQSTRPLAEGPHTDYIDLYLFHSGPDAAYDRDDLWHALNEQVEKGKFRYLGISLGASDNLHQATWATDVDATVIEVTYNRLNRAAEQGVFDACRRQNLGMLAREPLANGYLSGKIPPRQHDHRRRGLAVSNGRG